MPSALVAALCAPIREVAAMVGGGTSFDQAELAGVRDGLRAVSDGIARSWQQTAGGWNGAGAGRAAEFTAATSAAAEALADRVEVLAAHAGTASSVVARAGTRVREIIDRFEARAAALERDLESPGAADELIAEARRALSEAVAVVEELRAELDAESAAMARPATPPVATTPAGFSGGGFPGPGASGGAPMSPVPTLGGGGSGLGELARLASSGAQRAGLPESGDFGSGVAVRLPDGGTAQAPNAVAASAVRHALTQLGVPYDWGGTTPGVGLDCSGLTQWAYHEAGLNIPRLAQEQDIGAAIGASDLRPGDLAVWDGHVAMIVGDGQMIEAGDPVKLSPIRTTNAGQGFQGFWRPTA